MTEDAPKNLNTINFNMPTTMAACPETIKTLSISGQPIQLKVDTSTDWPTVGATITVGIGSILVALAVAYLTRKSQQDQTRAAKANFRNQWQITLRNALGEFISHIAIIKLSETSQDKTTSLHELVRLHATIVLMLDKAKPHTQDLIKALEKAVTHATKKDVEDLSEVLDELRTLGNDILEKAWQDIQNDIDGKS